MSNHNLGPTGHDAMNNEKKSIKYFKSIRSGINPVKDSEKDQRIQEIEIQIKNKNQLKDSALSQRETDAIDYQIHLLAKEYKALEGSKPSINDFIIEDNFILREVTRSFFVFSIIKNRKKDKEISPLSKLIDFMALWTISQSDEEKRQFIKNIDLEITKYINQGGSHSILCRLCCVAGYEIRKSMTLNIPDANNNTK
jgi:hypothetical protein